MRRNSASSGRTEIKGEIDAIALRARISCIEALQLSFRGGPQVLVRVAFHFYRELQAVRREENHVSSLVRGHVPFGFDPYTERFQACPKVINQSIPAVILIPRRPQRIPAATPVDPILVGVRLAYILGGVD
jgi:hypothetical protein